MLAVDGKEEPTAPPPGSDGQIAGRDQALLVRQRERDAALERPQSGSDAREADDRIQDQIGLGGVEELESVTVEEALAHPTWSMGPKITVDSATLANKGLELIEAHYLFGLPYERIEVVVHPTSVVHSLVRFRDGAALAHVGYPDMRVPVSFALTYPERRATPVPALDLTTPLSLEFEPPDPERFPLLPLAREAGGRGGTYPCAFNAANEVAVAAFLDERIGFLEIAPLVEDALHGVDGAAARDLPELVEADAEARRLTEGRLTPV